MVHNYSHIHCLDVDECQNSTLNDCSQYADCTNLDGTFACDCQLGFSGNGTFCTGMFKVLLSFIAIQMVWSQRY